MSTEATGGTIVSTEAQIKPQEQTTKPQFLRIEEQQQLDKAIQQATDYLNSLPVPDGLESENHLPPSPEQSTPSQSTPSPFRGVI